MTMHRSKIEWVLNPDNKTLGWIWNPITGCLNHTNGLCNGGGFPCYAYNLANGRLRDRYLANQNIACPAMSIQYLDDLPPISSYDPFYPRFWEERLLQPAQGINGYLRTKRKGIFVCDMSDLFGIGIPEYWTKRVLEQVEIFSQHRFYLLTKQPQNLVKFSPFPDNCWVGVSATSLYNFDMTTNAFKQIEAKVKYISVEPLLYEPIWTITNDLHLINWVIIGAQTKPYKPPKIEWVEEIVRACDKAGVPVFLKDNLKPLLLKEDMSKPFWSNNRWKLLRQDMPGKH